MKRKSTFIYLSLLLLLSCGKDDSTKPNGSDPGSDEIDLSITSISFSSEPDASLVEVLTDGDWSATCPASWITLSAYKGNQSTGILVGAMANMNYPREATVTIAVGNHTKDISVSQKGVPFIELDINGVTFKLLPVEADSDFYLDGATYLASRTVYLDSYFISETEVTNAQWHAVMGDLPYEGEKSFPDLPVIVNWKDITDEFLPAINQLTEYHFRLPTENEWEVAARGGKLSGNTSYAGSMYMDDVAWHYGNSDGRKHFVATKGANELGLYDMSGNVSEWCSDWYSEWTESDPPPAESVNPTGPSSGTEKVIRGGDFLGDRFEYDKNSCRIYSRNSLPPNIETDDFLHNGFPHYTGFRLVISKQ